MATIKVKYRYPSASDKCGSIYYQIKHEGKSRRLSTSYRLNSDEWDDSKSTLRICYANRDKTTLISIRNHIRADVERLARINRQLESTGHDYTPDDIITTFLQYTSEYTLCNYMTKLIDNFRSNGKTRTAETYRSALNSFMAFNGNEDIMLDSITPELMESYETWHRKRGNIANTISFYTRILRAVYNRAVDSEIIDDRKPFRHVYTGVDKTVKRAIPLTCIKRIKDCDLSKNRHLDYARDMFLMSFYLRGMSFVDMAFLRKKDLINGYVTYNRRKTGQQLKIAWTSDMQQIMDKYPANPTQYLLPIINRRDINERNAYHNIGYNINYSLKKIGRLVRTATPLTMYVARHSWASAAQAIGIPLSIISEGMGHNNEATTRIYLASLDTSAIDRANARILDSL
ncbi:MAG: site-specific integrase [Clostridiales bacterium]|nr:site-specific integrase [Clostridiales bacterium]